MFVIPRGRFVRSGDARQLGGLPNRGGSTRGGSSPIASFRRAKPGLGQTGQQGFESFRQHAHRNRREDQTHDACYDAHAGVS